MGNDEIIDPKGKTRDQSDYGNLTTGSDAITGTYLDDYIAPLGGSDCIDGKKGFNTVVYGMVPIQSEKDKYVGWITSGAYTVDSLAVFASGLALNPVVAQLTGMATTGIAFEMPS